MASSAKQIGGITTPDQAINRSGDLRRARMRTIAQEDVALDVANDEINKEKIRAERSGSLQNPFRKRSGGANLVSQGASVGAVAANNSISGVQQEYQSRTTSLIDDYEAQEFNRQNQLRRLQRRKARIVQEKPVRLVEEKDFLYGVALAVALFSDLLDLAIITVIPGLSFIFTFISTSLLLIILTIAGGASKRKQGRRIAARIGILAVTGLIEGIAFGLNFLPFETFAVIAIYTIEIKERRKAMARQRRRMQARQKRANQEELALSRADRMMAQQQANRLRQNMAAEKKNATKQVRNFSLAA